MVRFDIALVTYNRLAYLQKCIWSIAAATNGKNRIFVIDDNSNDGTHEWLLEMQKRDIVTYVHHNKKNMGTAWNFNFIIDRTEGKWFCMANDDMYFHRGWMEECNRVIDLYKDCGMVSFYDYTRFSADQGVENFGSVYRVLRTGMGCTVVNRLLFDRAGGFYLPQGKIMGFFASKLCEKANKIKMERNRHYATQPNYASHMDLRTSKLCEREQLTEYTKHRQKHK